MSFKFRRKLVSAWIAGDPGAALLMWYSEYDVVRSDSPQAHWDDLVEAAAP